MKKLTNLTVTQTPATFKDKDSGKVIDYMQYHVVLNNKEVLVKPVNAESKIRLADAFEEFGE